MPLSISSLYLMGQPFKTLLQSIISSEIKNWEIVDEGSLKLTEKRVEILLRVKKRYGVKYTVHSPFEDLNIASLNKNHRISSINSLTRSMELAAKLNSEFWIVHPGLYSGLSWAYPDKQWTLNIKALEFLNEKARKSRLVMCIENMPCHSFILGLSKDFESFIMDSDKLKKEIVFDIGHANTFNDVDGFLEKFGDRIPHMHIHDNYGIRDEHNAIGQGNINWLTLKNFLSKQNLPGFIVIESVKDTFESYKKAKSILGIY